MKSRGRIIKYLILLSILVISLLLCGCRSRLTDLDTATTTVVDEDGMMSEEYELRRYELGLYETKEPLFSGFDSGDDDEEYSDEEYDDEWGDYESEDEDYEEYEDEDEDDDSRTTSPVRRPTTTHTTPVRRPGTGTQTTTYVTIKFDPNGGTLSTQTIRKASGFTYGTLPAPEREGYTFEGWYTEKKDGKKVSSTDKITAKKDFTLYAHWKKIKEEPEPVEETYTVTFEPNGGEIKSGDSSKLLHKGDKYGSFPSVMWVGYKAAGWFTAAEGGDQVTESDTFDGSKDITLYAHWEEDFYGKWDASLDDAKAQIDDNDKAICCYIKKYKVEDGSFSTSDNNTLFKRSKTELKSDGTDTEWLINEEVSHVVYAVDDMNSEADELEKLQQFLADLGWEGNIIIVPKKAADGKGSDNEQLYYAIDFFSKIYGGFTDEDIAQAASELEIDL